MTKTNAYATGAVNSGKILSAEPVPIKIRGAHGVDGSGFNTVYAKGDFDGGLLRIYGSPTAEFDPAFPWAMAELEASGCLNFVGRANTFWLVWETGDGGVESLAPDIEFWVL